VLTCTQIGLISKEQLIRHLYSYHRSQRRGWLDCRNQSGRDVAVALAMADQWPLPPPVAPANMAYFNTDTVRMVASKDWF
jgi:hypothetical protein